MASAVAGRAVLVVVTFRTLTEHLLCGGLSSECSREPPSLNVLSAAQEQTLQWLFSLQSTGSRMRRLPQL